MKGRPPKIDAAATWLKIYLSGGSRPVADIIRAGANQHPPFSQRTLETAKKVLGIGSKKAGNDSTSSWSWYDPTVAEPEKPKDEPQAELKHQLAEIKRLIAPPVVAVPSADGAPIGILGKKTRPVDINDPETQARFEQIRKQHERFEAQQAVVTSPDPFALLEDAVSLYEVEQMMLLVRNHSSLLDNQDGDFTLEMGKWDSWVNRAKQREREFRTKNKL